MNESHTKYESKMNISTLMYQVLTAISDKNNTIPS